MATPAPKKPKSRKGRPRKLYRAWQDMLRRCYQQNRKDYPRYGGRGITVCDRWRQSLAAFKADMGEPQPRLTLDRIDNDGNYEPGNCRWATYSEQRLNQRGLLQTARTNDPGPGFRGEYCTRGHPFDDAHTYVYRGKRGCRDCRNIANREFQKRKAARLLALPLAA